MKTTQVLMNSVAELIQRDADGLAAVETDRESGGVELSDDPWKTVGTQC